MACYDNIIGLARVDCPCNDVAAPEGYSTSASGLYISDIPPFNEMDGYGECGSGSIWDVLASARTQAVNAFVADSNSGLLSLFKSRRDRFKGQIGEATGREYLSTTKQYAGVRLAYNPIRGGTSKITHIGTLFSAAGTVTAWIFNSLNQEIWTGTLTVANGWHLNTITPVVTLPTFIEFDSKHEYFLIYEYDANNPPRINKIDCGCGGFVPWYDTSRAIWGQPHTGSRSWANWLMIGGWQGDSITDFDIAPTTTGTAMNGLAVQMEVGCDVGAVLCNGTLDFTQDAYALSIAYAIYWKTAEIAASLMLGTTTLTRTNTVNREFLSEQRKVFGDKYSQNMKYIIQEATLGINDCLECKDDSGFMVSTVMS